MEPHDIGAALKRLPMFTGLNLAAFNQCAIGLFRAPAGDAPYWEMHADADELLHILEGEFEITLLTDGGRIHRAVPSGSLIVVPRGVWHRPGARTAVSLLYVTGKTEHSTADDPRQPR